MDINATLGTIESSSGIPEVVIKIAAVVILLILAVIVSSIAKGIVKKLLKMDKVNEFFAKFDSDELDQDSDLTFVNLIAKLAYWLVFLLFLMPILSIIGLTSLSNSIGAILNSFIYLIPAIIYAAIIVSLGLFIAKLVKEIVYISLYKAKVNELVKKVTFEEKEVKGLDISKIIAMIIYILLLVIFVTQALAILNLDILTRVSGFVIGLIPSIIAGLTIFIGAYILGSFLEGIILKTFNKEGFSKILAIVIKYVVWVIGIGIVLNQIGLDIMLINITYTVLLITLGTAIAISFGVGGIEAAKKIIEKNVDKLSK